MPIEKVPAMLLTIEVADGSAAVSNGIQSNLPAAWRALPPMLRKSIALTMGAGWRFGSWLLT